MKELNSVQLKQVEELGNDTSEEFASLMLKYTKIISSKQLDSLYSEAVELEELEELHCTFDMDYYSVAVMYYMIDSDIIKQMFGFYGDFNLYMDEQGRGLVVEYY